MASDDQVREIVDMVSEHESAAKNTLDEQYDLDVHDDLFGKVTNRFNK